MAVDYVIHRACEPKRLAGRGDAAEGTSAILEMLKARSRADLLEQMATRDGKRADEMSVVLRTVGPGGDAKPREVTFLELRAAAQPLSEHEGHCVGCPARFREQAYGCVGVLNYPISLAAETWLMDRLQSADEVGGFLCLHALADFAYDGAPIRGMRQAGLLESPRPVAKVMQKGWLSRKVVDSNQILQAVLAIGEPLDPGHVMGVLAWVGAIEVDGRVPRSNADAPMIQTLARLSTFEERRSRTRLSVGTPAQDPGVAGMQELLAALYCAWLNDAPTLVWP